ncbi:unnamed protein product [Rhizopus microsporus]
MALVRSNTLFVSLSLFFLPVMVLCAVLCLPLIIVSIVGLYLSAWIAYYVYARTDSEFYIPYHPVRVIKTNIALFQLLWGTIRYIPMYFSYLHWRYWKIGTEKFKEIVSQDIPYTPTCSLDVYHPNRTSQAPIIVFLYGGGWSSGSKVYYTTFANTLRELGYVVVVPDYRKYPEVKIDGIYEDVREAIKWVYAHAEQINGDPDMIYMMGHSAGAHLVSQVVLSDVIEKVKYYQAIAPSAQQTSHVSEKHDPTKHDRDTELPHDFLPPIEGLLLFAGVYDIQAHLLFETARGVERLSVMTRVMGSTPEGYIANSPMHLIEKHADLFATSEDTLDLWPRILFLHGQKDATVSMDQSAHMFNTIGKVLPMKCRDEVDVRMRFYKRMNHGEPVTALMLDMFAKKSLQKSLIRDIKEFIDVPAFEDEAF